LCAQVSVYKNDTLTMFKKLLIFQVLYIVGTMVFIFNAEAQNVCASWELASPTSGSVIHTASPQLILSKKETHLNSHTLHLRLISRIPEGKEIKRHEWRILVQDQLKTEINAIELIQESRRSKVTLEVQSECPGGSTINQQWFMIEPDDCQLPSNFSVNEKNGQITWTPVVGARSYEICYLLSGKTTCKRIEFHQYQRPALAQGFLTVTAFCKAGKSAVYLANF
jgi:hypothetical protein